MLLHYIFLDHWFSTGGDFVPREYLAKYGDILGCHSSRLEGASDI